MNHHLFQTVLEVSTEQDNVRRPTNEYHLNLSEYSIWVLFPQAETDDDTLKFYHDYESAKEEYERVFEELNAKWQSRFVCRGHVSSVIEDIRRQSTKSPLVINLCDGDEFGIVPGIEIINELERHRLIFTGADVEFYRITSSKFEMKRAFEQSGISQPKWVDADVNEISAEKWFSQLTPPVILKPAVSGGSLGVSIRSVVSSIYDAEQCLQELRTANADHNICQGGILAEEFIVGREFTTFIVGSSERVQFYPPVERVFHKSLPSTEQFLSFDRLWETYETESPMPNGEFVFEYAEPEKELFNDLKSLSIAAYKAVGGTGYGRIDIRQDAVTKKFFVLEVNAQCGLSEDENYTSIGAILKLAGESFAELTMKIMVDAVERNRASRA